MEPFLGRFSEEAQDTLQRVSHTHTEIWWWKVAGVYQNKGILHNGKQKRKSQENCSNKKSKLDEMREYWEIVTQFSHGIDFGLDTFL